MDQTLEGRYVELLRRVRLLQVAHLVQSLLNVGYLRPVSTSVGDTQALILYRHEQLRNKVVVDPLLLIIPCQLVLELRVNLRRFLDIPNVI